MKLKFLKDIKKSGSPCKEYEGQKYYIDTGNVNNDIIIGKELYSYKDKPSRANIVVETGDVLFAKMQNSIKVICINETNKNYIYSTGFYCLKDERILPEYLKYYFLSKEFNIKKDNLCQGATMKALNDNGLEQIEIEVPPISEQKRIVAIIDSLYSIIKLKNKQLDLLDELIKARFVELFGDPQINPLDWDVVNISEVVGGKVSNGFFAKRDDYVEDGNVSVLGVANIVNRMYSKIDELPKTNADNKDIEKFEVKYGDMLFCRSSLVAEGIGKASIIPEDVQEKILFECHVIRLPLDLSKCVPEFMQVLSTMEYFRNQVIAQSKTATMTTIGQDGILKTDIILPPIEKQRKFYEFVKQVDKSKSVCLEKIEKYTELYNKLMNDYFGG